MILFGETTGQLKSYGVSSLLCSYGCPLLANETEAKVCWTFLRKFVFLFPLPAWNADMEAEGTVAPCHSHAPRMETKDGEAERELRPGTLDAWERKVFFFSLG